MDKIGEAMGKYKVLFIGESWFFTTTEAKGTDQFTISGYETEIRRIKKYMAEYADITHIPAHLISDEFPSTLEEMGKYDIIIISDVGANTFLLHPDTFFRCKAVMNKLELIAQYVAAGGAFGMIGGYMTFMGIEGKARYKNTVIEDILPVRMKERDDRMECPQGLVPQTVNYGHPVMKGLTGAWPMLLGYNQVAAKDTGEVLMAYKQDPILVTGTYGKGRTFAWMSDCAPHWMPDEFCSHEMNKKMWKQLFCWCTK